MTQNADLTTRGGRVTDVANAAIVKTAYRSALRSWVRALRARTPLCPHAQKVESLARGQRPHVAFVTGPAELAHWICEPKTTGSSRLTAISEQPHANHQPRSSGSDRLRSYAAPFERGLATAAGPMIAATTVSHAICEPVPIVALGARGVELALTSLALPDRLRHGRAALRELQRFRGRDENAPRVSRTGDSRRYRSITKAWPLPSPRSEHPDDSWPSMGREHVAAALSSCPVS